MHCLRFVLFSISLGFACLELAWANEFPASLPDDLIKECQLSKLQVRQINLCLKIYSDGDCQSYANDPAVQEKLINCDADHVGFLANLKSDLNKPISCLVGGGQAFVQLVEFFVDAPGLVAKGIAGLPQLPGILEKNAQRNRELLRVSRVTCASKYPQYKDFVDRPGLKFQFKSPADKQNYVNTYEACINEEWKKNQNDPVVNAVLEVKKGLACFNAEAQSQIACNVAASFFTGGPVRIAAKQALRAAAAVSSATGKIADSPQVAKYLGAILEKSKEASLAVKLSAAHQIDLLMMLESPFMKEVTKGLNLSADYVKNMMRGILDSDIGKNALYWQERVFNNSPENIAALRVINGTDVSTPAGRIFNDIMKANFGDRSFFRRDIEPSELVAALKDKPFLQSYFHEMPGMSQAITEFNETLALATKLSGVEREAAEKAAAQLFKDRIETNFGHNGPHAGFYQKMGEVFPQFALKGNSTAEAFGKGTVFEGPVQGGGVMTFKYPGPISIGGVMHTFMDRISQATRGGMTKIFAEVTGKDILSNPLLKDLKPPAGLGLVGEMLLASPIDTIKQLKALEAHVGTMGRLSANEKSVLQKMSRQGAERLERQGKFLSENVERLPKEGMLEGYRIKFKDEHGNEVIKLITGKTGANDAKEIIEQVMLAEERVNGNPIVELLGKKAIPKAGAFYAASGATGAISLTNKICGRDHKASINKNNLVK